MRHRPTAIRQIFRRSFGAVRRFWPDIRMERGLALASLAALMAEVALRLLEPWPLKWVIDHILAGDGPSALDPLPVTLSPSGLLMFSALSLAVVIGLRALASYWSAMGFALVGNRVLTRTRARLYHHLQQLSLDFHNKEKTGDLVQRVVGDVGLLKDVVVTAALPLLGRTLVMMTMVAVMLWLNWPLAVLAFALLPLFSIRTLRLTRKIHQASRKQRQREGAIAATATESLGAIATVQALSLEERFSGTFSAQSQRSLGEGLLTKRLSLKMERTVDVAVGLATAAVVWYGAHLVLRGVLSIGDLVVFLHYLKGALKPAKDFSKYTSRIAKATAAAERVSEVLDKTPAVRDDPDARPAPRFEGEIELREVQFGYEPDQLVLNRLQLTVRARETVALVGPSGVGKSTIVSLLVRLYDPVSGSVLIDGRDVRSFKLASLRSQVGVVLQDSVLFATTVRENIEAGLSDKSDDEIKEAARLANAHEFIQALPLGYETVLGERGVTLSQGQRQRIAIARATLALTSILILDEPTSGLDTENARAVMEAVRRLTGRCTILLITHDLAQAALADRVLYLHGDRIAEQGSHSELLEEGGLYARLWRSRSPMGALPSTPLPDAGQNLRLGEA